MQERRSTTEPLGLCPEAGAVAGGPGALTSGGRSDVAGPAAPGVLSVPRPDRLGPVAERVLELSDRDLLTMTAAFLQGDEEAEAASLTEAIAAQPESWQEHRLDHLRQWLATWISACEEAAAEDDDAAEPAEAAEARQQVVAAISAMTIKWLHPSAPFEKQLKGSPEKVLRRFRFRQSRRFKVRRAPRVTPQIRQRRRAPRGRPSGRVRGSRRRSTSAAGGSSGSTSGSDDDPPSSDDDPPSPLRHLARRILRDILVRAFVGPNRPFRPRVSAWIDALTVQIEGGAS